LNTQVEHFDLTGAAQAWAALQSTTQIGAIRDERRHAKMVELLNELIDAVRSNEAHPLLELLDIVGELISSYEAEHYPIQDAPPQDVLRYLMDEHALTQSDLPEVGSQGVVSEILSGKRSMNVRQAKALAARFNVSPAVFI
jgi:HTH-type transcriptional regulator/antitoxin HigA